MKEMVLLENLAKEHSADKKTRIVLARVNGRLEELTKMAALDSEIEYVDLTEPAGIDTYKRSAVFVMLKAVYDTFPQCNNVKVEFSFGSGYFCHVDGDVDIDDSFIERVGNRMNELIKADIPIEKKSINTSDAALRFQNYGMRDKEKLFWYRRSSKVNVYSIDGFEDYFYGYMVPSTGYIGLYELRTFDKGFMILLPTAKSPDKIPEFVPQNKLFNVMKETGEWYGILGVDSVGALNDVITDGKINELILVQEALQEKKLADIAQRIAKERSKKFIMIAGPSSSGKTTTSFRLAIQLRAHGMTPHQISLDNYFKNRENTPRDSDGKLDYECLEALDIERFNKDMVSLLNKESVELPVFNFKTGKREDSGNFMRLGDSDVLVIEGIHGLNDKLSYALPKESKFKIYLSALTQLNVDEHNPISTTDGRLIRRMVRDARTRGTSAKKTIAMWSSVRRGEQNYIFPFQEEADVMFNSALIYELAVLKQYAEPLLFGIKPDEPEYIEAKRLLKFLDYFLGVNTDIIPINSILKEFVGGSCFDV